MRTVLPTASIISTPSRVRAYLSREGWTETYGSDGSYWHNYALVGEYGYLTWEQALIFTGFSKLNLMV